MVRKEETDTQHATAHTPKSIAIADDHPFVGDYLRDFCAERWPHANIRLHRSCTHVVDARRRRSVWRDPGRQHTPVGRDRSLCLIASLERSAVSR